MDRRILTRFVITTAIVMVIAASAYGRSYPDKSFEQRTSLPSNKVSRISINAVSEKVVIHDAPGDSIEVWCHGTYKGDIDIYERPHFSMQQQIDSVEITMGKKPFTSPFKRPRYNATLDIALPRQYAGSLQVEVISGSIELDSHAYSEVTITTVSGSAQINTLQAKTVTLQTTTGAITIHKLQADQSELSTVSGDLEVKALISNANFESVSGKVSITVDQLGMNIIARSTSGDLNFRLSQTAGFSLDARSTSGGISCDFPIELSDVHTGAGEHKLVGVVGNGKNSISAETVSGDISVNMIN